ncbi:MAG: glyoxylate/hydroxypyruvate reductase A [Alphaproteobacteria bacterium]|nr:glyoxylate/hydroxypyruvate reductase A [Alphaproteobacteria bacterium]
MALIYVSSWSDGDLWRKALVPLLPGEELRVWPDTGDVTEIDCALAWRPPFGSLAKLPNLKLIANLGAGVDYLMQDPDLPRGVPIVRLVDPLMTEQMTEYVVLAVMTGLRRLRDYLDLQREGTWVEIERDVHPPSQRTVGILGMGELGRDAARKLKAIGYRVQGWSRSPKRIRGIPCAHGRERMVDFVGACDALVCLLPLTPETTGILNRDLFGAMKPGAYLVNAARGGHLVDADLLAALESGHLSGAFLDVFHTEPLPAGHPFWTHPKVTVTPHIAALTLPAMIGGIVDNYRRMQAGQPLLNVIDLAQGY